MNKLFNNIPFVLLLSILIGFTACTKDDDTENLYPEVTSAFEFDTESLLVTFTNLSTGGETYLWDFGDGNTSTEINPAYTYNDYGKYTITLTSKNPLNESAMSSQDITICNEESEGNAIDPETTPLLITFNGAESPFEAFGGLETSVVTNPLISSENNSCNVYRLVKSASSETWGGTAIAGGLQSNIAPASQSGVIKLKVLSETRTANITVRLEFLPYPDVDPAVSITEPTTQVGTWEELTFDFSEHTDKTFKSFVLIVDEGQGGDDSVYYFDDFKQD